jgi:Pyrimidine dimer DNA glycosylase
VNIFFLHPDPILAATQQCDKHVVKMCLETAQMLSTVACLYPHKREVYKPTHQNHPCTVWARATPENTNWLLYHFDALLDEYYARYGKVHGSARLQEAFAYIFPREVRVARIDKITPPARAMNPLYSVHDHFDPVWDDDLRGSSLNLREAAISYRLYYLKEKARFARWKNGAPKWWQNSSCLLSGATV